MGHKPGRGIVTALGILIVAVASAWAVLIRAPEETPSGRPLEATGGETAPPGDVPVPGLQPDPIEGVLQQWAEGGRDEAVACFLEMTDQVDSPVKKYRLYDFSEAHFVSLPVDRRERLQEEMMAKLRLLREFARELDHRRKEARDAGDTAGEQRVTSALMKLASANTGPDVPKVVELVGRAIQAVAVGESARNEKPHRASAPPSP